MRFTRYYFPVDKALLPQYKYNPPPVFREKAEAWANKMMAYSTELYFKLPVDYEMERKKAEA